jgi:hypothetical protein
VSNKGDNTETADNSSARAGAPRGVRFDAARPTIGAIAPAGGGQISPSLSKENPSFSKEIPNFSKLFPRISKFFPWRFPTKSTR